MILFSCTNRAYQDVALVWAYSLKNASEQFEGNRAFKPVLFCTPDVEEEVFAGTGVEIRYMPCVGDVKGGHFDQTTTEGMVMRLKALDLLYAEGVEKVLYMDTDILVRGDISELLQANLTPEVPIAAASDFVYIDDGRLGPVYEHVVPDYERRAAISPSYFNSGVMLIMPTPLIEETRRYNCSSLEEFYIKHRTLCKYPDQDALNKLAKTHLGLPRRFNFFPELHIFAVMSSDELMRHRYRIVSEGLIVHYMSVFKPWIKHKNITAATAQIPFELYWEAVKPLKDKVSSEFYDNVKFNIESHRIIIEQARQDRYEREV